MNRVKKFLNQSASARIDISRRPLGWVRFTWDLATLPAIPTSLPAHYQIVRATAEDALALRKIFSSSFILDPTWSPDIGKLMPRIQAALDSVFESNNKICLALRHGARIVGGAILWIAPNIDSDASASAAAEKMDGSINQLAPGPTISLEYRNRGFGTLLLEQSLHTLREAGLTSANGSTRENSAAARFLYPKFGGIASPIEHNSLIAAA